MTPEQQFRQRVQERTKATYRAVRASYPSYYEKAVQIGHLASTQFERDDLKRSANVEAAVMSLVAELLEIVVPEPRGDV